MASRAACLLLLVPALALWAAALPARADVTLSAPQIDPQCRYAIPGSNVTATVDGTARSLFVFTVTVTVPTNEAIRWDGQGFTAGYVNMNGWPMRIIHSFGDGRGSGVFRCTLPGYFFRWDDQWNYADDDGLPPNVSPIITFNARSVSTDPNSTTPPNRVQLGFGTLRVTGRGREVLIPVDSAGRSDQFKIPKKAGGITVEPADPAHYGDGSASATYTFRAMYKDPEGLPPRPWIPYTNLDPYTTPDPYDYLGGEWTDLTTGVEADEHNVPRRLDDPWRMPTRTDPTLPANVNPARYRAGVFIVFDDNGDGQILPNPDQLTWWNNPGEQAPLGRNGDAPRFMVIDTDLQPDFRQRMPAAADWMNGVIFKYTVRATDHSVAIGIPRFFDFGAAVQQFALLPFSQGPGQKYLNAGRAGGTPVFDPRARSFVSLPAGTRRYTFLTSNDIIFENTPVYRGTNLYYRKSFGWYPGFDSGASVYDLVPRWWQQPGLNDYRTDPQAPPEQVFFPPFEVQVDPQITVEQRQLQGDTPLMLIGIPAAVHALRTDATGGAVDVPLYANDLNRATPSRLLSTDRIQWRFYYTQSQGLPPTTAQLFLSKEDASGSFIPVQGSPFACVLLASGAAGKDPIYNTRPDPTHLANAFYAQYGTTLTANPTTPPLTPGAYRYHFRVSDGRRAVEWPGDSAGRTSLTTQAQVSHVANTVRLNNPPQLGNWSAQSTVDPNTGAVSWRIQVTYTDPDNDAPSRPYLVFPDPQGDPTKSMNFVMQKDAGDNDFADGVAYELQSAADPTVGMFDGRREYYFAFMDNWKDSGNPEDGETAVVPARAQDGTQPTFFLNSQPFLLNAKVVKEGTTLDRGALRDNYIFSVTYGDNEADRPLEDANGVPQVRLHIDGTPTDFYLRTETATPDYRRGATYSVTVNGRQIGPGPHTFSITAADFPPDVTKSLPAVTVNGTGPSIDVPVLTEATVTGTPTVAGLPVTGYPLTDFVYQVRYRHQGGVDPTYVTVHVLNPSADGVNFTQLAQVRLSKLPGQQGSVDTTGFLYSNAVADGTSPGPFRFAAPGKYHYYVEASDGESIKRYYQYEPPDPDEARVPFVGPVVAAPALTPQAVDPPRGVTAEPFTFRVLYSHPAGRPPTSVRLRLLDPVGQPVPLLNDGQMTPPADAVADNLTSPGWLYSLGNITLRDAGTYRYSFTASDGATTVENPVPMAEGPTALTVDLPVLSDPSVSPTPGSPDRVTYRLTYRQSQNLVPTIFVVAVAGTTPPREYPMAKENPSDTDLTDGAVFACTLERPAGDGPHVYYFIVRASGINIERYPESNAVGPNVMPTLTAYAEGTVSPNAGHTGTPFTFRVLCRDVDAPSEPTASGFPRVSVTVGNQKIRMEYKGGNVQQEGAEFAITTKLPAGNLVHSFSAEDGFDTARLVDTTGRPFSGPAVLAETKLNLTLTPDRLPLDGITPIRVSGALDPPIPSTDVTITYTPPAGTATKQIVTATSEGRFNDTFIPDRSGSWTITAEFPSDTARGIGGGYQQLPIIVDPAQVSLPAGLRLVGLPVSPDGGALASVLGTSGYALARWNGAGYDFAPGGAMPTPAPGEGFWIFSQAGTTAQTAGLTVPHNRTHGVTIRKGWNQVANPFLVPISWSTMTFQESGGTVMSLLQAAQGTSASRKIVDHGWLYDGSQYLLLHASVAGARRDVAAWQGVWIKSNVDGRLIFAPPTMRSATAIEEPAGRRPRARSGDWTLQLVASNGEQSDSYNFAGVTADGRAAVLSGLESPPPVLQKHVDLYFTGQAGTGRYAADYRSSSALPQVYDFMVETDVLDRAVSVRCPNLSELPKDLDVVLEDVDAAGKRIYLRTASGYSFNPGSSGTRHLRLTVQRRTDGALRINSISMSATRAGRSISFSVSRASMTTVEILTPSGNRLKVLADRRAVSEGMNTVSWDLTRSDGTRLPRGIYVVQITAVTPEGQTARAVKPIAVVTW